MPTSYQGRGGRVNADATPPPKPTPKSAPKSAPKRSTRTAAATGTESTATPALPDPALLYPGATVNLTPTVQRIANIHFEGNIIPHTWYQSPALRLADGKANLVAVTLLGEICYWYRPTITHEEQSGRILSVSKKFAADKLHWDHEQRAGKFGLTKRQVQEAIAFLSKANLIDVEVRQKFLLPSGVTLYNQVFIEPIPDAIHALCTYNSALRTAVLEGVSRLNGIPLPSKRDTPPGTVGGTSRSNGTHPPSKREPYTENTTKTSPKTSTDISTSGTLNVGGDESEDGKRENVQRPGVQNLQTDFPEVARLVEQTSDTGSVRRFVQLYEICIDEDCLAQWDQAVASLTRAQAKGGVERPGAYFQTALLRLLERRQVFVPLASEAGQQDETRAAIALSLATGAGAGAAGVAAADQQKGAGADHAG